MLAVSDQHGQGAPCADQKSGRRLTIGHEHGHADELRFAPPALSCRAAARRGRGGSVVPHSSIPFAVGLQLCVHLQFTTHPLPAAHLLSAPRARCRSCWQWRPLRAGAALAAASGRTGEPACGWLAALAQRCRCVGVLASWLPCAARWLRSDAANVARWASESDHAPPARAAAGRAPRRRRGAGRRHTRRVPHPAPGGELYTGTAGWLHLCYARRRSGSCSNTICILLASGQLGRLASGVLCPTSAGQRPAAGVPRQCGHQPEAAGRAGRHGRVLPRIQLQRAPRRACTEVGRSGAPAWVQLGSTHGQHAFAKGRANLQQVILLRDRRFRSSPCAAGHVHLHVLAFSVGCIERPSAYQPEAPLSCPLAPPAARAPPPSTRRRARRLLASSTRPARRRWCTHATPPRPSTWWPTRGARRTCGRATRWC